MISNVEEREAPVKGERPSLPPRRRANPLKLIGLVVIIAATAFGIWYAKTRTTVASSAENSGGRGGGRGGGRPQEAVPVTVATVTTRSVPMQLRAIGNVEAFSAVAVRALVSGELLKVHFEQGQDVRKGQVLFTIDQRPLQSALEQAQAAYAKDAAQKSQLEAVLSRDLALLRNAQQQAARYKQLLSEGVVSIDQEQQFRLNAETSAATIEADRAAIKNIESLMKADQATIENARVQLSYATIRAPIDGRTGNLQIYAGNLIKANDANPLVTINQISPVYVTFSMPEQELAQIRANRGRKGFTVSAALANDETNRSVGELIFVDNTVDPATGTIRLKAKMPNAQHTLWPGQFVNVTLTLGNDDDAIVAPAAAVQTGQEGFYVYVVQPDQAVAIRPVKTGPTVDGMTVITDGLKPGETVVTDGQLRLVPGAKITLGGQGGGGGRGGRGGRGGGEQGGRGGGEQGGQAGPAAQGTGGEQGGAPGRGGNPQGRAPEGAQPGGNPAGGMNPGGGQGGNPPNTANPGGNPSGNPQGRSGGGDKRERPSGGRPQPQ